MRRTYKEPLEPAESLRSRFRETERHLTEYVLSTLVVVWFRELLTEPRFGFTDIGFVSELMRFEERELGRSYSTSSPINPPVSSTARFRESLPSVLPSAMSEKAEAGGYGGYGGGNGSAASAAGMSEGRKEGKGVWTFVRRGETEMARRASKAGLESGTL
jgi:hypothetical protein